MSCPVDDYQPMRWYSRAGLAAATAAAACVTAAGGSAQATASHRFEPATAPATASAPLCKSGYYKNVSGHCVHSPSSNPVGATAKCRDGTFSYSEHASGTCSHHGGVATWIHHP
jgi:Protein of unknown function (DUF3761)